MMTHREIRSELLKEVRNLIETRQSMFVCNALYSVPRICGEYEPSHLYIARKAVEQYISNKLNGDRTYIQWLINKNPKLGLTLNYYSTDAEAIKLRLAWIDEMIEENNSKKFGI